MKRFYIFVAVFLIIGGIFSVNAQDLIILKDGNIIESKVMELSETEIRYKKFEHLDGPNIVLSLDKVLSIRYDNKTVDIFNSNQNFVQNNQNLMQFYNDELFHTLFYDKNFSQNLFSGKKMLLSYQGQSIMTGLNLRDSVNKAFSQYNETFALSQSFQTKNKIGNILLWGGLGAYFGGYLVMMMSTMGPYYSHNEAGFYSGIGILGLGGISMIVSPFVLVSANKDLNRAVTIYNKQKISEFANSPSVISQEQLNNQEKNQNSIETSEKTSFGLSINPAGFIPNAGGGPSITLDFTKGGFNSIIDIRSGFGFIPSFYGYELFGIGSIFNYYHPSKIGGFYIGCLIEYTLAKNIFDEINHRFGIAGNIGYKFITTSGMYFRTGFKGGYSFGEGNGLIVRPDISFGYIF